MELEKFSDQTPGELYDHAGNLERDAEEMLRKANEAADEMLRNARTRANDMRQVARDIRRLGRQVEASRQSGKCRNCGTVLLLDTIGWGHAEPTDCERPEPLPAPGDVPVAGPPANGAYPPPTAPTPQVERPDGEMVVQPVVPQGGEPS